MQISTTSPRSISDVSVKSSSSSGVIIDRRSGEPALLEGGAPFLYLRQGFRLDRAVEGSADLGIGSPIGARLSRSWRTSKSLAPFPSSSARRRRRA